MEYKQLYIFVEGPDDERFIHNVILPLLEGNYNHIKIIKYATLTKSTLENFVKSCNKQPSTDYLFLCDMDARGDKKLCITKRKDRELALHSFLNANKIIVVREEIESWYFAGIQSQKLEKYKIKRFDDTQVLTKEHFEKLIPKGFITSSDFMVEILKEYSLEDAITKNKSLEYFVLKHLS